MKTHHHDSVFTADPKSSGSQLLSSPKAKIAMNPVPLLAALQLCSLAFATAKTPRLRSGACPLSRQ
jgi:hypothetical protein